MYLPSMFLFCLIRTILSLNTTDYLYRYGYVDNSSTTIVDLNVALIKFQEFYNLPIDGTLNNETIELMSKPRCDVSDSPTEFYTYVSKWTKDQIVWYFAMADATILNVADRVFAVWQNHTNLDFTYSITNPDIIISFSDKIFTHKNNPRCMKGYCMKTFDGKGGALAHAYPPNQNNCIEIHLDKSEDWYYGFNKTPHQTSLFKVLLHEVGHTLGIKHSSDPTSIMYAFYTENNDHLSKDDIEAVQYLYGKREESTTNIASTTSTIRTSTCKGHETVETKLDLCETQTNKFLITSSHHMYVFHKEWVWIINLAEQQQQQQQYVKPIKISDYIPLKFIPITHIYQNIYDDFVILDSATNLFYKIGFPDFTIKYRFTANKFNILNGSRINSVFNTHTGRTYIFYNNYYFVEIDECTLTSKARGIITEKFPGIPPNVDGAFRYKNGNIFFFLNQSFYEFNEFSNKIEKFGEFNLNMIGIQCTNKNILVQKIQALLSQLLTTQR